MSKRKYSNGTFYTAKQKEEMCTFAKIMMIPIVIVMSPVLIAMAFSNYFINFGSFRFFK